MTDTALAIPATAELARGLPSALLYQLERAGEISRQILDERVTVWAGEGWTQQQMAEEIGCSRQAISKRMTRLGIEPARPNMQRLRYPVAQSNGPAHGSQLVDWLPDMLPGASPEGAFRQEVLAWCSSGRSILGMVEQTGIALIPKSEEDRQALLDALAEIQTTAARLERQLKR